MNDAISIIAGGWSVREIDLDLVPGTIIGVNDSAIHTRCDIVVSMDRLWTENRWAELRRMQRLAYLRRSAVQNVDTRWPWCKVFDCDHTSSEFSERRDVLNGTNSGLCAFNLAYIERPKRIYLFGFDMCRGPKGEVYWFPPYPWAKPAGGTSNGRYAEWSKQFDSAAKKCAAAGIEVLNVSAASKITTFPKVDASTFKRAAA